MVTESAGRIAPPSWALGFNKADPHKLHAPHNQRLHATKNQVIISRKSFVPYIGEKKSLK